MASNNAKVRTFPNNFEAEQAMLGAILFDGAVAEDFIPLLTVDDFYNPKHKKIFFALRELYSTSTVNVISVNDMMEKQAVTREREAREKNEAVRDAAFNVEENITYLWELNDNIMVNAANAAEYFKLIRRDSTLRTLITNCNKIIQMAYEETDEEKVLRAAEALIYSISKNMQRSDLVHISKVLVDFNKRLNNLLSDANSQRGLMTGFKVFDMKTNGLHRGDLIILAARPSVGKTSFVLNIAANIAAMEQTEKKNIAIFSLEMPAVQLVQRMVCNLSKVPMNEVSSGKLEGDSSGKIWKVTKSLGKASVYIDDSSIQSPKTMLSKLRRLASNVGKVDLVIVDYLQLMEGNERKTDSRQQEISYISRMMKIIAKEIDCPLIVLSQMSRNVETRPDKESRLSDLRDSGAIEQDADIVMFLSRENEKLKEAKEFNVILNIAKHRNGELARIRLRWQGPYIRFSEASNQSFNEENEGEAKKPNEESGQ